MELSYKFSDIIKSSIIGTHCIYVKLFVDVPGILLAFIVSNFTKISANFITFFGAFLALIAVYFVLTQSIFYAAVFFYCSYICDFLDGKIARLRKTSSHFGKKLDLAFDRLIFISLSLSYLYYFDKNDMSVELLLLAFYALLFLIYDVLELTSSIVEYRTILDNPNYTYTKNNLHPRETYGYFEGLTSIKSWIPSRVGTLGFVFVLAPIVTFKVFYLIALFAILIRLVNFLLSYFSR